MITDVFFVSIVLLCLDFVRVGCLLHVFSVVAIQNVNRTRSKLRNWIISHTNLVHSI